MYGESMRVVATGDAPGVRVGACVLITGWRVAGTPKISDALGKVGRVCTGVLGVVVRLSLDAMVPVCLGVDVGSAALGAGGATFAFGAGVVTLGTGSVSLG